MWYAVTTGLTPHEALQQATAYFGRGGVGLHAIAQTPQRLVFQGGGGHVAIRGQPSATTTLALEARGWDIAGQRFMGQVSHRPRWRRKRRAAPPLLGFPILNNALEEGADR